MQLREEAPPGAGIEPQHEDRIFGLFSQLDPQARATGRSAVSQELNGPQRGPRAKHFGVRQALAALMNPRLFIVAPFHFGDSLLNYWSANYRESLSCVSRAEFG